MSPSARGPVICSNCAAPLSGRYCGACGQDNRRQEITTQDWVVDAWEAITSFDGRVVRTIQRLTKNPGQLALDYVGGQRAPYVSPARYVLGTCALWWAAVAWAFSNARPQLEALAASGPEGAQQLEQLEIISTWGQVWNLAFTPLLAPLVTLAFLGSGFGLAAHMCLVMFTFGHMFLLRAVLALTGHLAPSLAPYLNVADPILFVGYMLYALTVFHRGRTKLVWLRAIGAVVLIFAGSSVLLQLAGRLAIGLR